MKSLCLGSFCLLVFFPLVINTQAGNPFLGPIPVQYVTPGQELVLDMHRFFEPSGNVKLDFKTKDDIDVAFDAVAFQLRARAKKPGIFDVELRAGEGKAALISVLTLASTPDTAAHHFAFKSPTPIVKIYLAGSFNGWSKEKNPLTGPNENGEYIIDLPLEPGRYSYKFVVDGKWTLDLTNPNTEDNGMGDKNSVVTIGAEKQVNVPVIYADHMGSDGLIVHAICTAPLTRVSAIFEGPFGSTIAPARISGGEIIVPFSGPQIRFARVVAATADGITSNVVGFPVGPSETFRWQNAVLYYAFTDRFADGDKSNDHPVDNPNVTPPANFHGGDLHGIHDMIDNGYFESLGVNTIWVAPLNKNPNRAYQEYPEPHRWYTGYHGYWPVSSTEIDPHIGTDRDLRALVDAAHRHGMKVIADLVLHHVHEEHPWWKQHRDWFGTLDLPDGKKNLRLWDEQQFTTWFEPYLPSFDFSKDAPVRALIDNSIWWANTYKLDGFRLDAVKHILPSFWWKFRAALRDRVDRHRDIPLFLIGETFKDRDGIMSFVGPNMLDGQFDFPLYDQIQETFGKTSGQIRALDDALSSSERVYGKETLMSPLIGNHDKGRFMAYADGELPDANGAKDEEVGWKNPPKVRDPANFAKLELAQAFLMSIDGVPMIYYGDEIGMTGAGDPDNRRDMRFGDQLSADEKRVLENFRKLGGLRREHPALRCGSRRMLTVDHDVYAFIRAHLDDRVVAAFNRGKSESKIGLKVSPELTDGDYVDALSGTVVQVRDGNLNLVLPAQTAAFVTKPR